MNDPVTGDPTAAPGLGTEDTPYTIRAADPLAGFGGGEGRLTMAAAGGANQLAGGDSGPVFLTGGADGDVLWG